jgi:hypothetical protein
MSASVFHSGSSGTAAVNGIELPIARWEVHPIVELSTYKNSRSGTNPIREATFQDCLVVIDVDFDFGNNPFTSPRQIVAGAVLSGVKLFLHQSSPGLMDGPFWGFASLLVETTAQVLTVDGKFTTRFQCKPSGPFTWPA